MSSPNTQKAQHIAGRVWRLALRRGLETKRDIAAFLERDRSHVGRLLEGKARWTTSMLQHVAAKFEVPVGELIGEGDSGEPRVPAYRVGPGERWAIAEEEAVYETRLPGSDSVRALAVRGEAVCPLAHEGDVLLADTDQQPDSGDLAHLELSDGTATLARVFPQGERWLLVPVNPRCPSRSVSTDEVRHASKICGMLFGAGRTER